MAALSRTDSHSGTPRWVKGLCAAGGLLLVIGGIPGLGILTAMAALATPVMELFLPVIWVTGLYLSLGCGIATAYHGFRGLSDRPSGAFRTPFPAWLLGLWLVAIFVGWVAIEIEPLFGVVFLLAASMPPLVALAAANWWLSSPSTWRRTLVAVASSSVVSVQLAVVLELILPVLVLVLALPLREGLADFLGSRDLERLFYSQEFVIALVTIAVVAPLVEEATKPLGVFFLTRSLNGPREAFFLGMAGGAGFAILENMVYMGAAAWFGGVEWLGVAAVRGIGGILHPFNSGLVALGWYRWRREGNLRALLVSYLVAVAAHAVWNGFFVVMAFTLGGQLFPRGVWDFDIYGVSLLGVELLFMVALTLLLWWGLGVVTRGLMGKVSGRSPEEAAAPVLALASPRRLALWATVWAAMIVPVGFLAAPLVREFVDRL